MFSRNDVKLPGDLCEIVDDIWRPCAAPTAIGRHGDGWYECAGALACPVDPFAMPKLVCGALGGGLIGVVCCCTRAGYGEALRGLFDRDFALCGPTLEEPLVLVNGAGW